MTSATLYELGFGLCLLPFVLRLLNDNNGSEQSDGHRWLSGVPQ